MANSQATELVYNRPWLSDTQLAALFCDERYAIVEASTKSGKTVVCIAWIVEQAMLSKPNRHYWWVAPVYKQAKIAYTRIKTGLTPGTFKKNDTDLTLTLRHNGAILEFKGSDQPDTLYGEDVYGAVIDEGSRCKAEVFDAVRSTMTQTGAPIRIIGNVKGRKNWFYDLARRAQNGEPGYHYAKMTAYDAVDAGIFPLEELEDARRALAGREDVFKELYLAEASDDGGNPFGLSAIARQVAPLSQLPPVAMGGDLAKSKDWTVVIGLDVHGHVCLFQRWQGPWRETKAKLKSLISVPALLDSTGVGDPLVEEAQHDRPGLVEGFKFSRPSKQQLMEGLAAAIQGGTVFFPDGFIRNELDVFEYEATRTGILYSAPSGMHDDCVMALALAVRKWSSVTRKPAPPLLALGSVHQTQTFREMSHDWVNF